MSQLFRTRVVRADGRAINVVQRRAHLSYCLTGCCCGRTERGHAPVPTDTFKDEWLRRKLRNAVHLTKAGCLGPCALANVASLVFDGRAVWFHSWADALAAARALRCPSVVIDSENERQATGRPRLLAEALGGSHVRLADLDQTALLRLIGRTQ